MKTIVYKLILGLFFTLFAFNLNAQDYEYIPLVKPGVQIWTDEYYDRGSHYRFRRFALTDEDTIIENETYKKLYFFTEASFNPLTAECIGGLRENAQKQAFYKGGNIEGGNVSSGLICDFSLSVGDTYQIYNEFNFIVHSIDTLEFSGVKRRVISLKSDFDDSPNPRIVCAWIEGIGNKDGLLFDIFINIVNSEAGGHNRCYEHNGILLYHNYLSGIEDCTTPFSGLNEIKLEDNSITLYPNPASKEVNISSESVINSIEVFNSLGQSIYQVKVKSKEKTIDISSFSKGVYIIGVSTDKGYIRKKLIKN
ncbi:MAG: T9SS type A sorting domain-containing protein [Bacteroidales bacterium]|nr:T9SS type A sorting domain-containing protein [Bacteroidales bacterium]MDD3668285.1 T9SS type A sorting domain-containing protein [Bacteroidales bacterium]MDD4068273.1 T9SS type A sorting domain-containing protein [Bacteroidales bacterium]MDD4739338.1 T9SS type A sorting domain-containing protein [Bacteroidales bacterium]